LRHPRHRPETGGARRSAGRDLLADAAPRPGLRTAGELGQPFAPAADRFLTRLPGGTATPGRPDRALLNLRVLPGTALELVLPRTADQGVLAGLADELVVAGPALERVVARTATDDVVATEAGGLVVAAEGGDHVATCGAHDLIGPVGAPLRDLLARADAGAQVGVLRLIAKTVPVTVGLERGGEVQVAGGVRVEAGVVAA